ncbi:MAG: hypothetical protein CFE47_28995 [Pseudomonas sp. PGPPP1]|nr:MAG: hypothetical protein CFE47_28995 [Pseudomonas sp. PGPPP1]
MYQGPRNWVVQGLLQGACQSCLVTLKNIFIKRKAPECGALVVSAFRFLSSEPALWAMKPCPMPVHGAFKRCTACGLKQNNCGSWLACDGGASVDLFGD